MATARAIANGNWSSTSTWNGGVLPGNGDTVYANGFNVTINQDINIGGANNPTVNAGSFVSGQWYEILFVGTTSWTVIGAASNTAGTIFLATGAGTGTGQARAIATLSTAANAAAGATGGGGSFVMSSPFAITTDLRAGTTSCLSFTGATALTLDGLRVIGGSTTGAHGCNYAGTTTCTLANGIFTAISGFALNNASTGTINVSASCTFTGGGGSGAFALNNASTGTINVTQGTFAASAFSNAVSATNTGADVRLSGDFLDHWSGYTAVYSPKFRLGKTPTAARHRMALAGTTDSYVNFYTADNTGFGLPAATDVRSGVSYGGGAATGICAVPAASSVAFGVSVDNTTGTAVLTPAAIRAELATELGRIDQAISSRLAAVDFVAPANSDISAIKAKTDNLPASPAAVSDIPTADIAAIKASTDNLPSDPADQSLVQAAISALSIPSVADIRTELDANSTKLANLDASVSSRLASSAYTAPSTPPTAGDIASAVWAAADKTGYSLTSAERTAIAAAVESSILNEGDGQAVLNAIVGAIGNSNVDQIALVAAIRADLERTGGKLINLDATISSRLASADYNAPTSAPTAASVANAVWSAATRTTTGGTVDTLTNAPASVTPSDIWSHATRTITGGTVDTLTNAPTVPSAASIRAEIDSNSTQLAAIKAKTDLLPASPAATGDIPTADITAIKGKTDLLNTDRLGQCSTVATTGAQLAAALS